MYFIKKEAMKLVMEDYPHFRKNITERAIEENKKLTAHRKKLVKKAPMYGFDI